MSNSTTSTNDVLGDCEPLFGAVGLLLNALLAKHPVARELALVVDGC